MVVEELPWTRAVAAVTGTWLQFYEQATTAATFLVTHAWAQQLLVAMQLYVVTRLHLRRHAALHAWA